MAFARGRKAGWRAVTLASLALALWVPLAGCGKGGSEEVSAGPGPMSPPATPAEVRKEFVILRELVKQHGLQGEAGNEARVQAVELHLRDWLEKLPDGGANEAERDILRRARDISAQATPKNPDAKD